MYCLCPTELECSQLSVLECSWPLPSQITQGGKCTGGGHAAVNKRRETNGMKGRKPN